MYGQKANDLPIDLTMGGLTDRQKDQKSLGHPSQNPP